MVPSADRQMLTFALRQCSSVSKVMPQATHPSDVALQSLRNSLIWQFSQRFKVNPIHLLRVASGDRQDYRRVHARDRRV
jgi:hypothetical protein